MNLKLIAVAIVAAAAISACGGESSAPAEKEGHAEEAGHDEGIVLSQEQVKAAGIQTDVAAPAMIRETLALYGVVVPNAERVREVSARFPGILRTVNHQVGDSVPQGEVLATVESNESLQTYPIVAPLAGIVSARNANPGEQTGERSLFTVADLSTVWVELSLFPRDVAKVRNGQTVRIHGTDSGLQSDGKVVYVAAFGSSSSQTLSARVLVNNAERKWAPGLYVTSEVTLAQTGVPIAIRNAAIQNVEGKDSVFVLENGKFSPRPVQTGKRDSEFTEVTDGLKAGETYATRNSFILKAELGKGEAEHED